MNEFSNLLKQLNQLATQEYLAINAEKNPIVQVLPKVSSSQLIVIMQQYCILTKEFIVSLLQLALSKAREAEKLGIVQELQINLAEELGNDTTQGVPHYLLLADAMQENLGISFINPEPLPATSKLLENLKAIFNQESSHVFGATYAMELTSAPDMRIAVRVLNLLFKNTIPDKLQYFFDLHLGEWEPEHEANLRTILTENLTVNEMPEFEIGFRAYLSAMNSWWKELQTEIDLCPIS